MPDVNVDIDVSVDECLLAETVTEEIVRYLEEDIGMEDQVNQGIHEAVSEYDLVELINTNIDNNLSDEIRRLVNTAMDDYHDSVEKMGLFITQLQTMAKNHDDVIKELSSSLIKLRKNHNDWAVLTSKLQAKVEVLEAQLTKRSWWSKLWG